MAKKKAPGIVISRKGLFIWVSMIVFIACWMFVLGIIVGRGAAPVNLELGKLEQELAALKAKMFEQEQAKMNAQASGEGSESAHLGFYEALKSNKQTEPFKSLPQTTVKPKPATNPTKQKPTRPKPAVKPKPVVKTKTPTAPKPKIAAKPKPSVASGSQKGRFSIQVAASKDSKSAEKLVNKLRNKGYKAFQIRTKLEGKGVWYRVRVGSFKDRGAANKMLAKLKANQFKGMVVRIK